MVLTTVTSRMNAFGRDGGRRWNSLHCLRLILSRTVSPVRSADRAISAQMSVGSCGTESIALTGTTQLPPVSARQVCGAEGAAEVSTSHGTIACVLVDEGLL